MEVTNPDKRVSAVIQMNRNGNPFSAGVLVPKEVMLITPSFL
jgi:hypothetical protein